MLLRSLALLSSLFLFSSCNQEKPSDKETDAGSPAASTDGALVINAAKPSPHFGEVMKHLDIGGKALHYRDHEGRAEFWTSVMKLVMEIARGTGTDVGLPENFDVATMIEQSGLSAKAASGHSLSKDGPNWLMRHYAHYPDGMTANGAMLGEAGEFKISQTLPASTDIAFEIRLDGRHIPKVYRENAELFGNADEFEEAMKTELPIGMTVEKALSLSKAHVLMGMEFQEAGEQGMPPMPGDWFMEISMPDALIAALMPMTKEMLGEMQTIGSHQGWALPVPPDAGMGKPVLIKQEGALRIVSTIEHLERMEGSGQKLADDIFYKVATNHFPQKGNCQLYLSPKVTRAAKKWMQFAVVSQPEMEMLAPAIDKIDASKPWAMCMVVHPTGIETIAEMPYAIDASTATVGAVALGGTSVLFVGARAWKKGSDRSAVILTIRNCQQAMRGEQNMKQLKPGDPFTRKDLEQYMKFPEDIKVSGGWIRFEAGDKITPESGNPATNEDHIWLKVSGPGMDGILGDHGFSDYSEVTGW